MVWNLSYLTRFSQVTRYTAVPCLWNLTCFPRNEELFSLRQPIMASLPLWKQPWATSRPRFIVPTITQANLHVKGSLFRGLLHCYPEQAS